MPGMTLVLLTLVMLRELRSAEIELFALAIDLGVPAADAVGIEHDVAMLGGPADDDPLRLQLDDLPGGFAVGPFQECHAPRLPTRFDDSITLRRGPRQRPARPGHFDPVELPDQVRLNLLERFPYDRFRARAVAPPGRRCRSRDSARPRPGRTSRIRRRAPAASTHRAHRRNQSSSI